MCALGTHQHPPENEVRALFDEMSQTYGIVHVISSLGFAYFWRRRCAAAIRRNSKSVLDVMSGAGEMVPILIQQINPQATIRLVDFSSGMCAKAEENSRRWQRSGLKITNENALQLTSKDEEFDSVTCAFGLKTLSDVEMWRFASELWRVTKPDGVVSLLEFSIPSSRLLHPFFKLYVKWYVPILGKLFLGNPDNYRKLWHYTCLFRSCREVIQHFERAGFETNFQSHFFGCATQIVAYKRSEERLKIHREHAHGHY
jgi:demethylmenaquinone methyltransferase/2-methoxy-6-polyprenyl-1,4-benzoquinol methylase